MITLLSNADLIPSTWADEAAHGSVRCFNPGLIPHGAGWLLAYRVVIAPELKRRIAFCRLDSAFRVIPDTPFPFSDLIQVRSDHELAPQALSWFADPRLYRLEGRWFVYWNSGWHEPQNHQFLQEFDPASLRPLGPARELHYLRREKLEKNWGLFEAEAGLFAVYTVHPHRVLAFSLAGDGPITFTDSGDAIPNPAGYAQVHGGLRGGAPPQRVGAHYWSFCHSIENGSAGYEYVPSVYRFSATAPFAPTDMPKRPLTLAIPESGRRALPKLNPAIAHVIYPTGACFVREEWVVSLGVDDERCAIARIPADRVAETLQSVT